MQRRNYRALPYGCDDAASCHHNVDYGVTWGAAGPRLHHPPPTTTCGTTVLHFLLPPTHHCLDCCTVYRLCTTTPPRRRHQRARRQWATAYFYHDAHAGDRGPRAACVQHNDTNVRIYCALPKHCANMPPPGLLQKTLLAHDCTTPPQTLAYTPTNRRLACCRIHRWHTTTPTWLDAEVLYRSALEIPRLLLYVNNRWALLRTPWWHKQGNGQYSDYHAPNGHAGH